MLPAPFAIENVYGLRIGSMTVRSILPLNCGWNNDAYDVNVVFVAYVVAISTLL